LDSIAPTTLNGTGTITPIDDPAFDRQEIRREGNYELFTRQFECLLIGSGKLTSASRFRQYLSIPGVPEQYESFTNMSLTENVSCTGTPIVAESCTGVVHGTGQSTVNACVQYSNVAEGEVVRFSFSDGVSSQEIEVPVDENGKACIAATIFTYGQYTWQADLLDSSESGSIVVDENNQACSLIAE
jgi:hypothetical protein